MRNSKYINTSVVALIFAALVFTTGVSSIVKTEITVSDNPVNRDESAPLPDQLSTTSTFYRVREDPRRCMSPMCGGYFVKRVNLPRTRCANGRWMAECYVAEIDWNGQPQVEPHRALLRGNIVFKSYSRFGNLGAFRVNESWQAATDRPPSGDFYRVRDRGLRCITHPCPTHHEARLNSTLSRNIAGVDLTGANAGSDQSSEAFAAMTGVDGILAAGPLTTA